MGRDRRGIQKEREGARDGQRGRSKETSELLLPFPPTTSTVFDSRPLFLGELKGSSSSLGSLSLLSTFDLDLHRFSLL